MNLYHCTTVFQILEMIVHKERVHPGEYNVLLLADFTAKTYPNYRELESFFDEVRLFPYRSVSNNPDRILEDVESAYRDTVPYDPSEFENIYVAAAFYYFSLYLIARRIPFHMFEDGGGILTKPKVLYDSIHNVTPVMADIAETYGLLDGRNEYAADVICSFAAQSFLPDDPKWRDFDTASEIRHLSPETIWKILHFFRRLLPSGPAPDPEAASERQHRLYALLPGGEDDPRALPGGAAAGSSEPRPRDLAHGVLVLGAESSPHLPREHRLRL